MNERRLLVISSQCQALPPLSFLEKTNSERSYPEKLYDALTHPDLGGCSPALDEGLLVDQTADKTREAIERAFTRASDEEDMLLLVLIGHGVSVGNDFYFMAKDSPNPPRAHKAIHLAQVIKENYRVDSYIDGLLVLVDACYSGVGAMAAAAAWTSELQFQTRFDILAASYRDPAYNGCFTKTLCETLNAGLPDRPGKLLTLHVRPSLKTRCDNQDPQSNASNLDEGLFLAKNAAFVTRHKPWTATGSWAEIERLTATYQPTQQLTAIVEATAQHGAVAVIGDAGSGKSAYMAALARPEVTEGRVPERFVQAIVFLSEATDSATIADDLSGQLAQSVEGFAEALEAFRGRLRQEEWDRMDALQRSVTGPLRVVEVPVRIVVDGLDRLPEWAGPSVYQALDALAQDDVWGHVRLVVSSRRDIQLPIGAVRVELGAATNADVAAYLARRGLAEAHRRVIVKKAAGSWLVARLLADLVGEEASIDDVPGELVAIYDRVLRQAGATKTNARWSEELRPVLGVLAVGAVGPVLPIALLRAASEALGGPHRLSKIRHVLVYMRGFVVRARSGTAQEHDGLFHQSFAEYLLEPETGFFDLDADEARSALVKAIDALAPRKKHDRTDALHRYAAAAEAELLWMLGRQQKAFESLQLRASNIPAENLARWQGWHRFIQPSRGDDHRDVLFTRSNIAYWTGHTGDYKEALALCHALLPDQQHALGQDDRDTLQTRHYIAWWMGEAGKYRDALALCDALLPDQQRVLGQDNRDTLSTRAAIALWTGEAGDAQHALALHQALLPDHQHALGPDHPDTLMTRHNIARWTAETGHAREALALFEALLPDHVRVLGSDHRHTLATRSDIAFWIGEARDARQGLALHLALLPDRERVLGPDHPDTLMTRHNIAWWTGVADDAREALDLFKQLLTRQEAVLGPDHPYTLNTRASIARWTGVAGDAREALALHQALLPDRERVLGPDHPDTLNTRHSIALWTGEAGDGDTALRLYQQLLPDREQVLGPDHPDTLFTRHNIAEWTGHMGDPRAALALFEALLPDRERVLGPDHSDTLTTRHNIAYWTGVTGDPHAALALFEALLPDRERVLGLDHRATLTTRANIARWTGETGDAHEALHLYQQLLSDRRRLIGDDHPRTLTTRASIAHWTEKIGDLSEALKLYEDLLPDRDRVLGAEHPETEEVRDHIARLKDAHA